MERFFKLIRSFFRQINNLSYEYPTLFLFLILLLKIIIGIILLLCWILFYYSVMMPYLSFSEALIRFYKLIINILFGK